MVPMSRTYSGQQAGSDDHITERKVVWGLWEHRRKGGVLQTRRETAGQAVPFSEMFGWLLCYRHQLG